MRKPGRFFFVIESLLLLLVIWQTIHNPLLFILIASGIFFIYLALRRKKKAKTSNFKLLLGIILILFGLLSNPAVWLMLVFTILFIGLKGIEISGIDLSSYAFWNKKQMIMVQTQEARNHDGKKKKQQWFGNERIGNHVYEWDDININVLSGDTIIDLGNTILPKKDNVVLVRKGIGRTRLLVPTGIGVQLEHTALMGTVYFEDYETKLRNETLKLYSKEYSESARHLKIITNALVGDIEVFRV
ncbi:cell wall-active antibiotics response protein LiaF [Tetragenococcus halophilus]|uniref:cell wall-active antibiotics response protein LiaF n=1 Tax=Tetragenococcus halophilus TaxID=51669 RepID=UPI001F25375A|nr:cell wall-active antibiotics response protein LiaF [Tetragenococcus halophilus]MCF1686027.1 cell wall-active antibiotics response protein LiaF [Tetragenococcus halophilus]